MSRKPTPGARVTIPDVLIDYDLVSKKQGGGSTLQPLYFREFVACNVLNLKQKIFAYFWISGYQAISLNTEILR